MAAVPAPISTPMVTQSPPVSPPAVLINTASGAPFTLGKRTRIIPDWCMRWARETPASLRNSRSTAPNERESGGETRVSASNCEVGANILLHHLRPVAGRHDLTTIEDHKL